MVSSSRPISVSVNYLTVKILNCYSASGMAIYLPCSKHSRDVPSAEARCGSFGVCQQSRGGRNFKTSNAGGAARQ